MLLKANADLNVRDNGLETALHHAVRIDSDEIVLNLVEAAANCGLSVLDTRGLTPLHLAVERGNWILTDILLNGGANYKVKLLSTYGGYLCTIEYLVVNFH